MTLALIAAALLLVVAVYLFWPRRELPPPRRSPRSTGMLITRRDHSQLPPGLPVRLIDSNAPRPSREMTYEEWADAIPRECADTSGPPIGEVQTVGPKALNHAPFDHATTIDYGKKSKS